MDSLLQDLRYAVKGLLGTPGFAAITILCLALGIGVNSAVFSIADTVSLRPLPFKDAERLVAAYSTQPSNAVDRNAVSYQDFRDWKEQIRSFSAMAAQSYRNMSLTEGVESERFFGSSVTWNLFPLLGVDPLLGRPFAEADDRPGAPQVVMLSHAVWQRRYAGDPSIVGRVLIVNGTAHTVIGVMPPTFQFPQNAELWISLVGASLFVRSFLNIQNADSGIDTDPLMTMRLFMSGDNYSTAEAMSARVDDIVRRVEALPGVTAAFASSFVPLSGGVGNSGVVAEGIVAEPGREPRIGFVATTSHALRTIGHTLRSGRDFSEAEATTRSGLAIVNQALAKRVWPGQTDVVGRRFRLVTEPSDHWLTVIGTVADFQPVLLRDKATTEPLAILPYPYQATRDTGLTIRVAGGPPASITAAARQAIGQSDPLLALFSLRTGAGNRTSRYWSAGFLSSMFAIFGAVALFLAGIGIYGVLSYSVAQRTQEFGVRVALGATRTNVFGLVLGQGARLAGFGIAIGVVGAFLVTRMVQTILYNITPTDPLAFGSTAVFLALVTMLAGCVPASRATSVDPIVALRAD